MKIYNINDSREFFKKLASCQGKVKLVNDSGEQIELTPGLADANFLPLACIHGTIREMEIIFQDAEDCRKIFSYLLNKRGAAA